MAVDVTARVIVWKGDGTVTKIAIYSTSTVDLLDHNPDSPMKPFCQ